MATPHASSWQHQRERSNRLAIAVLLAVAYGLGRRAARLLLWPITLYFLLLAPTARRASRVFLTQVHGRPASLSQIFRHLLTFSEVTLDRLFLLRDGPQHFDIRRGPRSEAVWTFTTGDRGALAFMAHLGSFEVLRINGPSGGKWPVNLLMDRHHAAMVTAALERANPTMAAKVIDLTEGGPGMLLQVKESLARGELVALMADRVRGSEATVEVPFLGGTALMPLSPWRLALALRVPVLIGFGLNTGNGRYDTHVELFAERPDAPRGSRDAAAADLARRYAERLEHYARMAPNNWFNFYDFWR